MVLCINEHDFFIFLDPSNTIHRDITITNTQLHGFYPHLQPQQIQPELLGKVLSKMYRLIQEHIVTDPDNNRETPHLSLD